MYSFKDEPADDVFSTISVSDERISGYEDSSSHDDVQMKQDTLVIDDNNDTDNKVQIVAVIDSHTLAGQNDDIVTQKSKTGSNTC